MSDYLHYTESDGYSNVYNRRLKTMEYVYYKYKKCMYEMYKLKNKLHNIKGPAIIRYYKNGQKECETYYINHKTHNSNGPALIRRYYKNGQKECETYYINHKTHNYNGPALILYDKNGHKIMEYWIDGEIQN